MRRAYLADASVLSAHGAQAVAGRLSLRGWEFETQQSIILNESERADLGRTIRERCGIQADSASLENSASSSDGIFASGRGLHLPPMIFKSFLRISNGGFQLHVCAQEAIQCWAAQHVESRIEHLKVYKVPFSKKWIDDKGIREDGSVMESSRELSSNEWDWTYSTDYLCSISNYSRESSEITSVDALQRGFESIWVSHEAPSRIDYALLSRKEDILFFDDVVLYQDDLDDCGEVQFSAKVRVMPSCWFLLCRYHLPSCLIDRAHH